MGSTKDETTASVLRERGNELYGQGDLEGALCHYLPAAKEHNDHLSAANATAALYELGYYFECIKECMETALWFRNHSMDDLTNRPRAMRLMQRAATCLLVERNWDYAVSLGELAEEDGEQVEEAGKSALDIGSKGMIREKEADDGEERLGPLMPGCVRGALNGGIYEMIVFSHGPPYSMLDGGTVIPGIEKMGRDEEMRVGFKERVDGETEGLKNKINVLKRGRDKDDIEIYCGGVGDGRHVFETLRDYYDTVEKGDLKTSQNGVGLPKIHFVLNDVRVETLARILLMFVLFYKLENVDTDLFMSDCENVIPRNKKSYAQAAMNIDKCQQRFLEDKKYAEAIEYATLVYHCYVSAYLLPNHYEEVMKVVTSLASSEASPYPWLTTDDPKMWDSLRNVYKFWSAKTFRPGEFDKYITGPSGCSDSALQMKLQKGFKPKNLQIRNIAMDLENMKLIADGDGLKAVPDSEREQIVTWVMEWQKTQREGGDQKPVPELPATYAGLEERLIRREKIVAPAVEMFGKYEDFIDPDSKKLKKRSLRSLWKPNITWLSMRSDKEKLDYFTDNDDPFDNHDVVDNIATFPGTRRKAYVLRRGYFDHAAYWFAGVGKAVRYLADAGLLKIDFAGGEMHQIATHQRQESFDIVNLNNVPDYTHLVNAFVFLGPLLRPRESSRMLQDIRVAPERYNSVEDYALSNTQLMALTDCSKAFGLKFAGGSLHDYLKHWEPVTSHDLLSREGLEAWLERILLATAFPPPVYISGGNVAIHSLTMTSFFEICVNLCRRGYKKHWLAHFLEQVAKNELTISAKTPRQSPCPVSGTLESAARPKAPVDLGSILPEFRALLSYYVSGRFPFGVSTVLSKSHWYAWPMKSEFKRMVGLISELVTEDSPSLGVLFFSHKEEKLSIPPEESIAKLLRKCQANPDLFAKHKLILSSVVRWSLEPESMDIAVYLTENDFNRMVKLNYVGIPIRTDT
eukprot:Plantae.Rhodophyta-Hildenbrandia_rubra.ctg14566.p1 GENE.Plantae.Rhodophyta-Hildenbrandia_rubra.ctg14566~~Plantae.Rhodophyta-Hildenbrandia_rubra.ctg14566.p1  ORF type:complete len:971 (-),score=165.82 Plantae.Rhodophyta-Hildenbrandia_rubra.ctg14566:421-3333(-)